MDITLRLETKEDHRAVEFITREAFWNLHNPGCDEHLIVHNMRGADVFVPELDFVACIGDRVVGNVMYTKARIVAEDGGETEVLCLGPLSVLPEFHGRGIGSMLVRHSVEAAKKAGHNSVFLFGHPGYYPRFGFRNAREFNIQTSWGANIDPFMWMELHEGALDGVSGKYFEPEVFKTEGKELEEFDKQFPFKEKRESRPDDL